MGKHNTMNKEKIIKGVLSNKFDSRRIDSALTHFLYCIQKFQESDWESSLIKAGKFIEVIIKMLWIYCGKTLPRQKNFKTGRYAQKIIDEISRTIVPENEIRLQIPRACIFIYDVTSNRGARHDSEDLSPNEMDAIVIVLMCSWILAELIRFSAKQLFDISKAKEIVDSLMKRRYPIFEEIDGRIYVDTKKFKSATECSLLILYSLYPKRISKKTLKDFLNRHGFKQTAIKFERLVQYVDVDDSGEVLLRATGRRKAENILKKGDREKK